jgi:DNA-binding response OmpR family regulator
VSVGFCPSCGCNLTRDEPVEVGPWKVAPDAVWYEGQLLRLTLAEATILHTLARANGRAVKSAVLGNRACDSSDTSNSAEVLLSRIRKKLGPLAPFENIRGAGYRWMQHGVQQNGLTGLSPREKEAA